MGVAANHLAGNPGGLNLNGNAGVNIGNDLTVKLGNPAGNNQGIPVIQVSGNMPPPVLLVRTMRNLLFSHKSE